MLHPRFARQAVCTCDAPVECGVSWTSAISPNATPLKVHFSQNDIWFGKGYALHGLKQFAEAEICYMKVLELNKNQINENRAVSYYNLACIYSLQKLWERSFVSLKQALEIAPNYASDVQSDEDLEGLVTHPIYSSKVKISLQNILK